MSSFFENIKYANAGIRYFFKSERNGRIQAVIGIVILLASWFFAISAIEWCIVLLLIGLVISLEMINTALERVCAIISLEYHPMVKIIKDVTAGAVWLSSISSVLIGLIIFIPYVIRWLNP